MLSSKIIELLLQLCKVYKMQLSQQFNEKNLFGGDENVLELERGDGYITL